MRQAVLVIHGIGEQKPMATLRGFVHSMGDYSDGKSKWTQIYNIPDTISKGYELRQFALYYGKDRTDFYECYWANNMRGTKIGAVWSWLFQLMFRKPSSIPKRIRWIYFLVWFVTLIYVYVLINGSYLLTTKVQWMDLPWAVLATNIILHFGTLIMTHYMGDAARYTYADPDNVDERNKIREAGIDLLNRIHESTSKYERIIVVGHSLGSIIGYDILKHLWSQYHKRYTIVENDEHSILAKFNKLSKEGFDLSTDEKLNEYQELQEDLWKEQRRRGNPWKVTDFITLGSPLAHAELLLAESPSVFEERKKEREFPTSPPVKERDGGISYWRVMDGGIRMNIINHAGPFAFTRWHNFYYKSDYVGGPLRGVFGRGIRDTVVRSSSWANGIPFLMHTRYWGAAGANNEPIRQSVSLIKKIILG